MKLSIEGLPNSQEFLYKAGTFFMLASSIEKFISEFLLKNNIVKSQGTLGAKIFLMEKLNREDILDLIIRLKQFKNFRNNLSHDNIIVDPIQTSPILYFGENLRKDNELEYIEIFNQIDSEILFARNLLFDLFTLNVFDEINQIKFKNIRESGYYLGYNNRGC